MRKILLLLWFLAIPAHAEIADYGSFLYELYQEMQENHTAQPVPPLVPSREPVFQCQAAAQGLSCEDDRHRRYSCTDHGATGQYCQRADGNAWIHCLRQLLGRYKCSVVSIRQP